MLNCTIGMKIIFALGNPGLEYAATRHNIAWQCADLIAIQAKIDFKLKSKFSAEIADISKSGETILLAKPTTFYNLAGQSLRSLMDFYKISNQDILVIQDDLSLEFGKIRIRQSGSPAGNNGIKSINAHIGESYTRLRIGTLNDSYKQTNNANFVLGRFSKEEQDVLDKNILPQAAKLVDDFINNQIEPTSISIKN